jgi:Ca2+-binding RTX toxin-like protein
VIDDIDSNGTNVLRGGDGNDTITFGNGTNTIEGGVGDDLIRQSNFYPSNNANTIAGGQGNDRMESGGSPDTYLFARGDGHDTIRDWDFYGWGGKLDRVVFGAGIAAGDVAVSRSGNHLVLRVNDPVNPAAVNQITVEDWNTSGLYRIEQVCLPTGRHGARRS